jgi:hypothetical protein
MHDRVSQLKQGDASFRLIRRVTCMGPRGSSFGLPSLIQPTPGLGVLNNLETNSTRPCSLNSVIGGEGEVGPWCCCTPDGRVYHQLDRGALF